MGGAVGTFSQLWQAPGGGKQLSRTEGTTIEESEAEPPVDWPRVPRQRIPDSTSPWPACDAGLYSTGLNGDIYCLTLGVRFVWDGRRAAANLKKHRVSFEEASTAFDDELGAYYPDTLYEDRFILIGYSRQQRLLYVVHAEVKPEAIRIISARKATRHEKTHYEHD